MGQDHEVILKPEELEVYDSSSIPSFSFKFPVCFLTMPQHCHLGVYDEWSKYIFISIVLNSIVRLKEVTTRTIPVSEEVYKLLEKLRLPGERYDDTILRLAGIKARGKDFDRAFKEALDAVVKEDAELLERLAQ